MDASDIIRKLQSRTAFNFIQANLTVTQPMVNISTCGALPSSLILNFTNYQDRQLFYQGKQFNSTCTSAQGPFS
jgi:hypothetical protein